MMEKKGAKLMEKILIRALRADDVPIFTAAERAQGWSSTPEKLNVHLRDHDAGRCVALMAEYEGEPAGYVSVYWNPQTGALAGQNVPEIVDFAVLERFRRLGVGSALMDAAEGIARTRSDRVWLGVGLHAGYGAAQRLYVRRGYVPDGSGVWFRDQICPEYAPCVNDDDLVLYMIKEFSR